MLDEISDFLDAAKRSAFLIDGSGAEGLYEAFGFDHATDDVAMYRVPKP